MNLASLCHLCECRPSQATQISAAYRKVEREMLTDGRQVLDLLMQTGSLRRMDLGLESTRVRTAARFSQDLVRGRCTSLFMCVNLQRRATQTDMSAKTGEKPFVCITCGKPFAVASNMRRCCNSEALGRMAS